LLCLVCACGTFAGEGDRADEAEHAIDKVHEKFARPLW
jgi:hypothetical protein